MVALGKYGFSCSAFCYAPSETQDRRYFVSWQLGEIFAFLADGYIAGDTAAQLRAATETVLALPL
jgi:hypothetical protein